VTGDYDAAGDVEVLARGIGSGLDELVRASGTARPAVRRHASRPTPA